VLALATVLAVEGLGRSSGASFAAQTANRNTAYAFTAVYAPGSLTATTAGHDVSLSWPAGTNGNGYALLGAGNGTSTNCSSASFGSIASSAATTYTDTNRYTPQGTEFCYEVQTSFGAWTSVNANPVAAAQLGVVASTAVAANGGTAGDLTTGDTIVITFNQPMTTSTGPAVGNSVCSINGATIMLASTTTSGNCSTSETVNLGTLTGGNSTRRARYAATYAWSSGNTVLTVTIGARTDGSQDTTLTGTWTFNPSATATTLVSATGNFHVCDTNAGGGNCLPVLSGGV
jgi:hypothetical protein